jgi:hypothetical protein
VVYLRSIIAGVVALLLATVLIQAIIFVAAIIHGSNGNARWVLLFRWHVVPIDWLLPIIIFGAGFYWEYRRLSK